MGEVDDKDWGADLPLRERQEHAVRLEHSLTKAGHELAREAFEVGRTMHRAGIDFDPLTFVALRIVEGSCACGVDPVDCLNELGELGFLERSVALVVDLFEDAA